MLSTLPSWVPFALCAPGERPKARPLETRAGVGDRLRSAAFAELQAREGFLWAAERFVDAPPELAAAWRGLAAAEEKHRGWLMARLEELGCAADERPVSDALYKALAACRDAREFALLMAKAERRGLEAGELFRKEMAATDPVTAELFGRIAEEERAHIALAERYFPAEAA